MSEDPFDSPPFGPPDPEVIAALVAEIDGKSQSFDGAEAWYIRSTIARFGIDTRHMAPGEAIAALEGLGATPLDIVYLRARIQLKIAAHMVDDGARGNLIPGPSVADLKGVRPRVCNLTPEARVRGSAVRAERAAARTEDLEFLAAAGETFERACERVGSKPGSVERYLRAQHRQDLLARFRANKETA